MNITDAVHFHRPFMYNRNVPVKWKKLIVMKHDDETYYEYLMLLNDRNFYQLQIIANWHLQLYPLCK